MGVISATFQVIFFLLSLHPLTKFTVGHVPDAIYEAAQNEFTEQELIDLTIAVITINSYHRINIAFPAEVGNYRPGQ